MWGPTDLQLKPCSSAHQQRVAEPTSQRCTDTQRGLLIRAINVDDHPAFDGHEEVLCCHDTSSGLHAIIAVHSTTLGPALGGCRMWDYASEHEALTDVLRLSQGMSYKHAVADICRGGGKAVSNRSRAGVLIYGLDEEGN
jgi:glutamate dehydrogenase/leucine dehydrogenase